MAQQGDVGEHQTAEGTGGRPWHRPVLAALAVLVSAVAAFAVTSWATASRVDPQAMPLALNTAAQSEGGIAAGVGSSGGVESGWIYHEAPDTSYHDQVDGVGSSADLVGLWRSGMPDVVRLHCDPSVDPRIDRGDWIDPWGTGQAPEFVCQVLARPRLVGPEVDIGVVTAREVFTNPGSYVNVTMVFSRSRHGF